MTEPVRVSAIYSEFHLQYRFGFTFLVSLSKYVMVLSIHNLCDLLLSSKSVQNSTIILTANFDISTEHAKKQFQIVTF
jgi:hypothetical protein